MKKNLIFLSFFLFFNASFFNPILDTQNIDINLTRLEGENIRISWAINYQDYDDIVIEISHKNEIENYQLTSPVGVVDMCCYPDYVRVTIKVLITKIEEVTGPDCDVGECKKFIQEEYVNQ